MKQKPSLYRMLIGAATLLMAAFSMSAQAATSVSWTSPADGSSFPVGTMVMPTGNASAIGTTGNGLDLALVLDSSGSMGSSLTVGTVTKSRAQWQKDAALALVNNLPTTNVAVTIIEFDSDANTIRTLTPLTSSLASITAAINSVDASGGTDIRDGIVEAQSELTSVRHTAGWSQQMVVFSDGGSNLTLAVNAATAANTAGIAVHSVLLTGGSQTVMQQVAAAGGGTFIDASTPTGVTDLIDLFSGVGGNLVGIDRVDIEMPDGTIIGSIAVDAFGNFKTPGWFMELGANTFIATAYGTDGTSASATLTLNGTASSVPEPGLLGLLGLGLIGMIAARRRKV